MTQFYRGFVAFITLVFLGVGVSSTIDAASVDGGVFEPPLVGALSHQAPSSVWLDNDVYIEFVEVSYGNGSSTWTYDVYEDGPRLRHWILELPSCVGVVSATSGYSITSYDSTTGLAGIKWNVSRNFSSGRFSFTLDNEWQSGTTTVAARTKNNSGEIIDSGDLIGPTCSLPATPTPTASPTSSPTPVPSATPAMTATPLATLQPPGQSSLPKFSCDGTVYHIKNDKLYRIDIADGSPTVSSPFLDYNLNMNSLGFNPLDNYLYMQASNKDILRVGSNGSYENLGPIAGINSFYFVGDFLRDGTYVLGNGNTLHMVDLSTMTVIRTVSVTANGSSASYSDIAVSPIDGKVYVKLQNHGNVLATVDLGSGVATTIGPSYSGNSGSVWFDEEGTFFAYSYDDGNFYKIDTTDGSYEVLGNAERPTGHDATSCPYSFGLNLDMADIACPDPLWQDFRTVNGTNEVLSNLTFKQTLPEGFAYAGSDARLQTVFANNFGNDVVVSRNGRSLIVTGLTANLGTTDFQLEIAHDGNDATQVSFRANIEGLSPLYGSIVTSDDPDTAPSPDETVITVEPCDSDPEPPQSNIPVISCDSSGNAFNTGHNHATGSGTLSLGTIDSYWDGAVSSASGPNSSTVYGDTYVVGRLAGWASSPFANSEWVSILPSANMGVGTRYVAYRHLFEFEDDVDPSQFALEIDYFADDYIVEVYINGLEQSRHFTGAPLFGASHQTNSYSNGQQAGLTLDKDWQDGQNEIVILTFNVGTWEGFLAQVRSTAVCPQTDFGDAPSSYGGAEHAIVSNVYLGSGVDNESLPAHSIGADGDDEISDVLTDDEDGATVPAVAYAGGSLPLTVWGSKSSGPAGYVRAWADFDRNGSFDAAELLDFDQDIAGNVTSFNRSKTIDIPADAACGKTYVRIRYSLTDNMTSTGTYSSGETEDYALDLLCGEISGYVWQDEDGDGSLNGAETQMGATISLYKGSGAFVQTVVSLDGSYLFTDLPIETYNVVVTGLAAGYIQTADPDGTLDSQSSAELTLAARFATMNFGYRDASFDITGTVWHDENADGQMAGESGFDGATVKLISADLSGVSTQETTTDSSGKYIFNNVAPGSYRIEVDKTAAGSPIFDYQSTFDVDDTADGVTVVTVDNEGNLTLGLADPTVDICHIPPGSPEDAVVISVGASAYDAHIAHGDLPAPCPSSSSRLPAQMAMLKTRVLGKQANLAVSTIDFGFAQGDVTVQIIDLKDPIGLEETAVWEVRVASIAPTEGVSVTIEPDDALLLALSNSAITLGNPTVSSDNDWDCSYVEADGLVTCDWLEAVYPTTTLTESQIITLSMRVPGIFPADSFTAIATVHTNSVEIDETNNSDSAVTSVDRTWVSETYIGELGLFTHIRYDEDLVEDVTEIESDLSTTIVNPLQVPISVTFGLTATERPKLVVAYCESNVVANCLSANADAYITGTIIVREYMIDEMRHVISGTAESTLPNLVSEPFTVTLGADTNQGRSVVNGKDECDQLSGDDCLLTQELIDEIVAGMAVDAPERPIYEWQDDEYMVINLYTNGGRAIEIEDESRLIEDSNAKPGVYRIEGTMTIRIEFDDVRLGAGNTPYVVDQTVDIEVYMRVIAPFVEAEN